MNTDEKKYTDKDLCEAMELAWLAARSTTQGNDYWNYPGLKWRTFTAYLMYNKDNPYTPFNNIETK